MNDFQNKMPKILVIGDLIIDSYLWGSCDRISPEAPVQVVTVTKESTLLGGAGNVVNNLNSLGAQVDVISVIGKCEISIVLRELLNEININTQYLVTENNRVTSKKSRIIAANQQVVRYDRESTDEINKNSQLAIENTFKKIVNNYDSILLSDYGKGVLTDKLTRSIIKIANKNQKKVLVDPKGLDYSKYKGAYLMTPNKSEASEATRITIKDNKNLYKAIHKLKEKYELEVSLITLSEQGLAIFDDEFRIYPTSAREIFDVTGAGDTILASLGFALSCNKNIDEAVKFANLAAGVVVGKLGSATTSINEIINYKNELDQTKTSSKIKSHLEIKIICDKLRERNRKIVFTNGCFDILHSGHIKYLEESKTFGEILIVGLNSDRSVKVLKGQNRPINNESDRAYILAALKVIDYLVIFDNDTPEDLINNIKPNIITKGGDYEGKEVVGGDIAKEVKIINFVDGKSTTKTIQKIKKGGC